MVPTGIASKPAPRTIKRVPETRGKTPNDFGSRSGSQEVPNKKSKGLTRLKKVIDSFERIVTIPMVVSTEISADIPRTPLTPDSNRLIPIINLSFYILS